MKSTKAKRIRQYAVDRFQEPSTWRGIALICTVLGWKLSPDQAEVIVMIGLLVSGLIGTLFPVTLRRRRCDDQAGQDDRGPRE